MRGGGCRQSFQGGTVYWSPSSGSHLLSWVSAGSWLGSGAEGGFLGYPASDAFGPLRDGGWGQHFQGGSVYWSPATGAHTVSGAIRSQWSRLGWEGGRLGYPTSDQYGVRGGLAQNFQHGTITWTQKGNRLTTAYRR
jgi:uncharacterized protein with LGFP repeats